MGNTKRHRPNLLRQLTFSIHSSNGSPVAFQLDVRAASLVVLLVSSLLLMSVSGSLLFFRELEINRKLEERVLELEITEKLARMSAAPNVSVQRVADSMPAVVSPPSIPFGRIPLLSAMNPETNEDADSDAEAAPVAADPTPVPKPTLAEENSPARETPALHELKMVAPRVGVLNADCAGEKCSVSLSLVPTGPGLVQGSLLVILETEIPRIGTANANAAIRERYFIYPGETFRDELPQTELAKIPAKPFHFSRGLQSNVDFNVGSLLRPLAVNVYIFDTQHNLIQHERKDIGTVD
jgi:hypothetical protein